MAERVHAPVQCHNCGQTLLVQAGCSMDGVTQGARIDPNYSAVYLCQCGQSWVMTDRRRNTTIGIGFEERHG